ncbi:MAG: hypothetical protein KQJ78_23975 [Deltaproteobacteria bacterium]|nr:hypothetical protein [Deltaproteobacteria bacterium]
MSPEARVLWGALRRLRRWMSAQALGLACGRSELAAIQWAVRTVAPLVDRGMVTARIYPDCGRCMFRATDI